MQRYSFHRRLHNAIALVRHVISRKIANFYLMGNRSYPVVDPSNEEVVGSAPSATIEDVDAAMGRAARAQPAWAALREHRIPVLLQFADAIEAGAAELGELVARETGKPLAHALGEARNVADTVRAYVALGLNDEVVHDGDRVRVLVERVPIGVVAAITPWNFPLGMAGWKLAPALRAGNTVVLKPSPFTPLATLRLGEIAATALPEDVLTVVSGGNEIGAAMVSHPVPRKVTFTGSVATGRRVGAAASRDLKRLTLELGGNDPAIVLDDVDLDMVGKRLFWGAFNNNGQACVAAKRVYAPRHRFDEVVEALASAAGAARVGRYDEPGVQLGPISNRPQFDRVVDLVADGVAHGGRVAAGGARIRDRGFFHAPTVVAGPAEDSRLVCEEQFGPVVPVLAYDDEDDAVARANAGHFGLGASVWSSDLDRADAVGDRLVAGTVWVNDHGPQLPGQPFGGLRMSGVGVENGKHGLDAYVDLRVRHRPAAAGRRQ